MAGRRRAASPLPRRLPVLGIGKSPPPVRLAGKLIRTEAPVRQDLDGLPDDPGLGGHVGVSDPGGKVHRCDRFQNPGWVAGD